MLAELYLVQIDTHPLSLCFVNLGVLNIYKLNIHQILLFLFKTKHGLSPKIFDNHFSKNSHAYNTRFSENNFIVPKFNLKLSRYSIRYRGPFLWNNFLSIEIKQKQRFEQFKTESKRSLLQTEFDVATIPHKCTCSDFLYLKFIFKKSTFFCACSVKPYIFLAGIVERHENSNLVNRAWSLVIRQTHVFFLLRPFILS